HACCNHTPRGYHSSVDASKPGYTDDKQQLLTRLRRIEGQVRGLERMIEDGTYCIDVLTQVAAVSKALQGVGIKLLDEHLQHCVDGAAASGDDDRTEHLGNDIFFRNADLRGDRQGRRP